MILVDLDKVIKIALLVLIVSLIAAPVLMAILSGLLWLM